MYLDISTGNAQRTGRSLRVSKVLLDYEYDERYVQILAVDAIEDISETFGFQTGDEKVIGKVGGSPKSYDKMIAKIGDGPNIFLVSQ